MNLDVLTGPDPTFFSNAYPDPDQTKTPLFSMIWIQIRNPERKPDYWLSICRYFENDNFLKKWPKRIDQTCYSWFISSGAIDVNNRLEEGGLTTLSDLASRFS